MSQTAGNGKWRLELAQGLRCAHSRTNQNAAKNLETASFLYALIELLEEVGLIDVADLDRRKRDVFRRLKDRYQKERMGVLLQDSENDKYTFERSVDIDCEDRLHLCKGSCCRLPFALSRQDLEERVVRWDLTEPYLIEQNEDGYCTHNDRCTKRYEIYAQRPLPCRGYDCRKDQRIWLDFDKRIPNPAVERDDWLTVVSDSEINGKSQPGRQIHRRVAQL